MKKMLSMLLVAMVICIAGNANALPLLVNGDFSQGSTGWASSGDVDFTNGRAELGSDVSSGSDTLSQDFYISPNTQTLAISFDYIFSGSDTAWFSSDNFDAQLAQLITVSFLWWEWEELDYTTLVQANSNDDLSTTTVHFSRIITVDGDLTDVDPNASISFCLNESSPLLGSTNTLVAIDNVSVDDGRTAPVPEPATLLLLGSGLLGAAGLRRRNRK